MHCYKQSIWYFFCNTSASDVFRSKQKKKSNLTIHAMLDLTQVKTYNSTRKCAVVVNVLT